MFVCTVQVSYERNKAVLNKRLSTAEFNELGGSIRERSGDTSNDLGRYELLLYNTIFLLFVSLCHYFQLSLNYTVYWPLNPS